MPTPEPPFSQLVVEVFVRDLEHSLQFYESLGFRRVEMHARFASLAFEHHLLFLDERPGLGETPPGGPRANVRIMIPDVDAAWARAQALGAPVAQPLADRSYGLRDFTIVDPDGFGVRFATRLT